MDNAQVSREFPFMCCFIFGLRTAVHRELIKRSAVMPGARLFRVYVFSFFVMFCFNKNKVTLRGEMPLEATEKPRGGFFRLSMDRP